MKANLPYYPSETQNCYYLGVTKEEKIAAEIAVVMIKESNVKSDFFTDDELKEIGRKSVVVAKSIIENTEASS